MHFTPNEKGYLLEDSSGNKLNLTMTEALELAPLAHQIQDHIRSRYPRTPPVLTYAVREVILGLDAHHTEVIVQMQGPHGLQACYRFSLDTAKSTRDGLTRKIEQIESAQLTRTKQ